jgi:chorismate dehydratase
MYRFLVLPYVNALPLVHYIKEICPQAESLCRTPRWSVDALLRGSADAALIPVVDCFTHPELQMIPRLGICSDGDVTSVLLQCRCPLPEVGAVELDPDSRTSNVLAQVLIRDHFRLSDRVKYTSPGSARAQAGFAEAMPGADAAARVCIGDRALCAEPAYETYDLSGEWKKMTGLPFVFAVWAFRRSCTHRKEISQILYLAKEIGCRSRPALAKLCSKRLGLPENRCLEYLTDCIHYDLGPSEQEGMNLFRELAVGLLEPGMHSSIRAIASSRKKRGTPILEWS